jgi:AcrR family transcriptional regulator
MASAKPRATVGDRVRENILDHAEELFAERGFFGASVRDITEHAGVRLAAVNYHFGTKEELFRDVILRRARVLHAARLAELAKVPRSWTQEARTRAIVEAFMKPAVERALHDGLFRNYFALIAQLSNSRLWALKLVADQFNSVALEFIGALGRVFPRAPKRAIYYSYQFLLSTTLSALSDNLRLDSLTRGELSSRDFSNLGTHVLTFATAGIVATCSEAKKRGGRRRAAPRAARSR